MSEATLKAATLAVLNSGASWTQGANARFASGISCAAINPAAVSWDIFGALQKAQHESAETDYSSYHAVYATLRSKIPVSYKNTDIESYNDDVTWAEIAALFV